MTAWISFGEWVQTRRNQLRYSRPALAHKVGCSPHTLKKIERDERRPSAQMAELLATYLQIPESEQDDFIRRARGEFVAQFSLPPEIAIAEANNPTSPEKPFIRNLPAPTTSFVGREVELAQIGAQLANPNCRLLTILGAGGMGKTRLAVQVAHAQQEKFTDGLTYVSLAAIAMPAASDALNPLLGALADALQISFHGQSIPEQQLGAYLQRKEMLIVFDNFEHLLETAVFLPNLLAHAPDIKILTTSRERLDLQEEWLFPLTGLDFAAKSGDGISEQTAVQLFQQRAQQLKPTFDLEAEETAVLQICQLVEGMPLALELAATWVRQMSCAEIASEIQKELDFLATRTRNMPERHRSIRALFTYSWQRMTAKERTVLQRLSVFRGGFERGAAKAVANASLPLLQRLVDQSLLSVGENGRYAIHELLRQFAAEKLAESAAEENETYHHHCQHFLTLVGKQEPRLKGADVLAALNLIEADMENIRSAIRWGLEHQPQLFDKSFGVSLEIFVFVRSWFLEGEMIFRQIANKFEVLCEASSGQEKRPFNPNCLLWLQYRTNMGISQAHLGQMDEAAETHRQSLAILTQEDTATHWVKSWCLLNLAYSEQINRFEHALEHFSECEKLSAQVGDDWLHAICLSYYANGLRFVGQFNSVQEKLEKSLAILDRSGEQVFRSFVMSNLARLAKDLGDLTKAHTLYQECLAIRAKLGLKMGLAWTLLDLGNVTQLLGNLQLAHDYFQQSVAIGKEANMRFQMKSALWGLGNIALANGDFQSARKYYQESNQLSPDSQSSGGLGWVAMGLGDFTEAKQQFRLDLQNMLKSSRSQKGFDAFVGLAHVAAHNGQCEQALELLALVKYHPSSTYEHKQKANKLWQELTAELPHETAVRAEVHGKQLDFLKTVEQFIMDSPLPPSYAPHKNRNLDD